MKNKEIKNNAFSVSKVTSYIKNMFDQDFMLGRIFVTGEVSNCKYHSSGHIYFTLKDDKASLMCVMFSSKRAGLDFELKDGDKIITEGNISVYESRGSYQLYVNSIKKEGFGELYEKVEALKRELEEMGMFDELYKKPIPRFALKVGVVTSPTGAVIQDIINVSNRRNPYVSLILCPALVQGEGAIESIVKGIERLDAYGVDVIIVGRGGGSIEDLWAFCSREVSYAIFNCATPVITAIGHQTDTTIADYVADLRAPTPSAAAELAVFAIDEFDEELSSIKSRLNKEINRCISLNKMRIEKYRAGMDALSVTQKLNIQKERLEKYGIMLKQSINSSFDEKKLKLKLFMEKLNGVSPLKQMERGFSYVESKGSSLRSVNDVAIGEGIRIVLKDGIIKAVVEEIEDYDGFVP